MYDAGLHEGGLGRVASGGGRGTISSGDARARPWGNVGTQEGIGIGSGGGRRDVGGSQSFRRAVSPWSGQLRGQGGFAGTVKRGTEGGSEGFVVLFIGGHTCGSRGAERRATSHGIATVPGDL